MNRILSDYSRRAVSAAGTLLVAGCLIIPILAHAGSPEEAKGENNVLARCTKILSYGDNVQYYKPSKKDAVIALGLLGDERAVPILIAHLQNETNNELRLQIVRALGWIGSTKAVPALEDALHDNYPHIRIQAAMALKELTGKDYDYDKTGLPEPRKSRDTLQPATAEPK